MKFFLLLFLLLCFVFLSIYPVFWLSSPNYFLFVLYLIPV